MSLSNLANGVKQAASSIAEHVTAAMSSSEPSQDDAAPRKKSKSEHASSEVPPKDEDEDEEIVSVGPKHIKAWNQTRMVSQSWNKAMSPSIMAIQEVAAFHREAAKVLPPADGCSYEMPRWQADAFVKAMEKNRSAMEGLKTIVSRNMDVLLPEVSSLKEANAQATAEAAAASEAAAEAADKLRATNAALHQSSSGHSDIGSAFPLTLEIAEKVKGFSASDAHTAFLLEVLCNECDTVQQMAEAMNCLHFYAHSVVKETFREREAKILSVLEVDRTPLVDGFLRKLWQQSHEKFLPTEHVAHLIESLPSAYFMTKEFVSEHSIASWQKLCAAPPPSLVPVIQGILQLYVFTLLSDPPLRFDAESVGQSMPFDPKTATPLDDKIKPGTQSVILCPALYSADGLIKAKAKVLAADYL